MDLEAYRARVKGLLGAAADPAIWSNDLLDAGLRSALREYAAAAPLAQLQITSDGGRELDLAAAPDLAAPVALAWPWRPGAGLAGRLRRTRPLDPGRLWLEDEPPGAGETMLLVYRRLQTISGLDGAAATTIPAGHGPLLALGAAGWAAEIHYRQVSDSVRGYGPPQARGLASWAAARLAEFREGLDALGATLGAPDWGGVGM